MKALSTMVIFFSLGFAACKQKTETYTTTEKQFNQAVYASGKIMPMHYEMLKSTEPMRILAIMVKEGDLVKKGQPLVILGSSSEKEQLSLLSERAALARNSTEKDAAEFKQLKEKISLAKQQYQQDALNAERYMDLAKDKAVAQKDADKAALQAKTSLAQINSLQAEYHVKTAALKTTALNAEEDLARFKGQHSKNVLTSNLEGKVWSIDLKPGEITGPGETILWLGSKEKYKLELLIDERDIRQIQLGQKVFFETDAFAERQFEGIISKIDPVLQKDTRSFKVEAQVAEPVDFFPQSSVEANILIRQKAVALMVPGDYILPGDSVLIQKGDQQQKIKLTRGTENDNWVEVKAGLKKGDVLIKNK
ncbi:Multidrug efflux pump subunit AcrA (membrane-fusion protein) [Pedobacter steynii]|uniref:Multidrug efflux pump subunit AcrA (Membrane-fusion protein) n=1 Tax=Pedobacter steynii TaxID=430522 RepID=A0A1H0C6L1_9SPHI|nr:HlyD family efflux transporter periplasmic adaptor subunit [Pedobacter steynii]NQX41483.1 HlyD family efflux transporter periplasmic adaptor subunit [Pedobacter steynii]SDN53498.1 Multidrug efflux pump subunit AcrA (membrane-fusion protein) [Pedobacter steynii]